MDSSYSTHQHNKIQQTLEQRLKILQLLKEKKVWSDKDSSFDDFLKVTID